MAVRKAVKVDDTTRFADESRTDREAEESHIEEDMRDDNEYDSWFGPTGALKAPPPRRGYEQRWVRAEVAGKADPSNVQKKFYDHKWQPRKSDTLPRNSSWFTEDQTVDGTIKTRGMILCERPVKIGDAHRKYLQRLTREQKLRVQNDLERSSYVLRGMKPIVVEDKSESKVATVASD